MTDIRRVFLAEAATAASVLAAPAVAQRWEGPSALAGFRVRGLGGHLVRAAAVVERYLDEGEPRAERPLTAAQYYVTVVDTDDLDAPLHRSIRDRGEEMATVGHDGLVRRFEDLRTRLSARLPDEPADRLVTVVDGLVLRLDDYLVTRVVELVVHTDDLAVSVGVAPPAPSPEAAEAVVACLVGVARERHGDLAVVRALARRERDEAQALRVL